MILHNYTGHNILINRPYRIIITNGKNSLNYNSILLSELIRYISKRNYTNIKIYIEPQEVSQFENDFDTNSPNIQNIIYNGIINIVTPIEEMSYSYYPSPESVPVSDSSGKIHTGWLNTSLIGAAGKIPIGDENGYLDSSWVKSSINAEPYTIPMSDENGKIKNSWLSTSLTGSSGKIPIGTQDDKLDNSWINISLTGEHGKVPIGNPSGKLDNSWLEVSYQSLPNKIPIANNEGKINIDFIPPSKMYYARNQKSYQWPIADPSPLYNVFNMNGVPTALSNFSVSANMLYLIPFYAEKNLSVDSVYIISRSNINQSTTIQFAIYNSYDDNDIYYPYNMILDTSITLTSILSNQVLTLNMNTNFTFDYNNVYWLALLSNRAMSIAGFSSLNAYLNLGIFFTSSGGFRALHYVWLSSVSVMPAMINVSQINFVASGFQNIFPAILYKAL